MSDFIPNLRLQNIFGSVPNFGGNSPPISTQSSSVPQEDNSTDEDDDTKISKRMQDLYEPKTDASKRFANLLANYPKREEPGMLRTIAATLMGIGSSYNPDHGFIFNPDIVKMQQDILDKPFKDKQEDWLKQVVPAQKAAEIENEENSNSRKEAYQTISSELRDEALQHKKQNDEVNANIKQQRADIYDFKAKNPGSKLVYPEGGNIQAFDPITKQTTPVLDSQGKPIPTGTLSKTDQLALAHDYRTQEIETRGNESRQTESIRQENRGWQLGTIPDPNDPSKQIGVRINQITGETKPIQFEGQNTSVNKLGTTAQNQPTAQTRAMMEGATMLRPHINDLRNQAVDLDKRGLFGPVMSRVRELATKIGTTGNFDQDSKSLQDFATAIQNDPLINQSNDRAVGQFVTNLGLMASGAGRVHGGARGGGSIQMVNYLKSLLSSNSSLDMFQGRLDTLDDYMKGYSAGPTATTQVKKSKLDAAIDEIFGSKK